MSIQPLRLSLADPLALSGGVGARLVLAGAVLAALWAAVAWAMSA
ncbi:MULTISPECIES: hypothetical protein [Roseomonadaceae]|nr:hypothetical protein [Roseomonas oleicola]